MNDTTSTSGDKPNADTGASKRLKKPTAASLPALDDEELLRGFERIVAPVASQWPVVNKQTLDSHERQRNSENSHRADVLRETLQHQRHVLSRIIPLVWGALMLLGGTVGAAFYVGRPDIAYSIIALAIGWIGGYGYGRSSASAPPPQ